MAVLSIGSIHVQKLYRGMRTPESTMKIGGERLAHILGVRPGTASFGRIAFGNQELDLREIVNLAAPADIAVNGREEIDAAKAQAILAARVTGNWETANGLLGTNLHASRTIRRSLAYTLLEEGVAAFNRLRESLSEATVNLRGVEMPEIDLSGATLSGAELAFANLSRTRFSSKTRLDGADLTGANLAGADLSNADLSTALVAEATYSSATRFPANFDPANLGMIKIG
ncbi:MAG: pentapeptide repeat-containing protein [Candidatus Margulisiibacteriota bacterium]